MRTDITVHVRKASAPSGNVVRKRIVRASAGIFLGSVNQQQQQRQRRQRPRQRCATLFDLNLRAKTHTRTHTRIRTLQSHYSLKRVHYCVRTAHSIGGIKRFLRYVRVHELNHLLCDGAQRALSQHYVSGDAMRPSRACAAHTCGAIMMAHRSSVCVRVRAIARACVSY